MSAFMLEHCKFHELVLRLAYVPSHDHSLAQRLRPDAAPFFSPEVIAKVAMKIVMDWHKANARAVTGRYGDVTDMRTEDKPRLRKPEEPVYPKLDPISTIKLLRCLLYQCHETVRSDAEQHEKDIAEIERALGMLAFDYVQDTPEYKQAAWSR